MAAIVLGSSNTTVGRGKKFWKEAGSRSPDYKQVQGKKQSENKKSGNAFN